MRRNHSFLLEYLLWWAVCVFRENTLWLTEIGTAGSDLCPRLGDSLAGIGLEVYSACIDPNDPGMPGYERPDGGGRHDRVMDKSLGLHARRSHVLLIDGDHKYCTVLWELLQFPVEFGPAVVFLHDTLDPFGRSDSGEYPVEPSYQEALEAMGCYDPERHGKGVLTAVEHFLELRPEWRGLELGMEVNSNGLYLLVRS